jgi:hypothetical protein
MKDGCERKWSWSILNYFNALEKLIKNGGAGQESWLPAEI